jgi:hypothetical protein
LTTAEKARKRLIKIIHEYHRGDLKDSTKFRALVYAFSTLLQFYSFERDGDIEKRLVALEKRLDVAEEGK